MSLRRTARLALCRTTRSPRARTERLEPRTLLTAGDPDATFGVEGFVTSQDVTYLRSASDVAVQGDGKFVVAGQRAPANDSFDPPHTDLLVSRFNADGTVDPTFGNGGSVVMDFGRADGAVAVKVDAQGRPVVAAQGGLILRLTANGRLDPSFGTGGVVTSGVDFPAGSIADLDLAPDGRIVAIGLGASLFPSLLPLPPAGHSDLTFDGDGRATVPNALDVDEMGAAAVTVMPDGRVVVTGVTYADIRAGYVARFTADGSPDATFDGDGIAPLRIEPLDVAVDSAGRPLIAGGIERVSGFAAIERHLASGQL